MKPFALGVVLGLLSLEPIHGGPAIGPLRVSSANPRYFADPSGKIVFLTGSHTWGNLQDYRYSDQPSPPEMDFDAYLDFLKRHHHNFFRLWAWESAINAGAKQTTISYDPLFYERPGPGLALDGKPKFDLSQFNPPYFDRLRARVEAAGKKGIYASVMLFNGFSIEGKGNVGGDPWRGHPFNRQNNINGIDGGTGSSTHTLTNPAVTAFQEAYVRLVIDTVHDLDNVLFEITNEDSGTPADTAWQIHFIRFVKACEASRPKQHPVGMTSQWPDGNDVTLAESPSDWISPVAKVPLNDGRKVVLNDTDHSYFWIGLKQDGLSAQRDWVWENLTRGNQCLFMDPYLDPSHDPGRNNPTGRRPDPYWDTLRDAMGQARDFAERLDLRSAIPHGELASTKCCLANPGKQYLVYVPRGGEVTVDLTAASGKLTVDWLILDLQQVIRRKAVAGGEKRSLQAPLGGAAVLLLKAK